MVGPPGSSLLLLSLLFLCCPGLWSYEAPIDKQDVFAKNACPAFLTYRNVAYLSGVTVELPCRCKPETVTLPTDTHLHSSLEVHCLHARALGKVRISLSGPVDVVSMVTVAAESGCGWADFRLSCSVQCRYCNSLFELINVLRCCCWSPDQCLRVIRVKLNRINRINWIIRINIWQVVCLHV